MYNKSLLLLVLLCSSYGAVDGQHTATVRADENEVDLELGQSAVVNFYVEGTVSEDTILVVEMSGDTKVLAEFQTNYTLVAGIDGQSVNISLDTVKEGQVTLTVAADSEEVDATDAFVVVSVMKDPAIDTAAMVLGWISTIAWDFSFLPQIWHNYRRFTVEGLSFDFLTFNFIGFSCYLMFNAGLYWIDAIQDQFRIRHPNEVLHVRLNDVIFPLYAVLCTAVQIAQCFYYPKAEGQKVSLPCRIISALLILLVVISCILVPTVDNVLWIDVLYLMSYVKLFISMIKYAPQLFTNFKAKSTAGWSIFQVILDFTGGVMSLIQMFLIADNYDDLHSVLSDPTKLGLGLLSIFFNIFFFIQHFILYRGNEDDPQSFSLSSMSHKSEDALGRY